MKRFKIHWVVALVACLAWMTPLSASAEGEDAGSGIDVNLDKAFDYAICAVSIVSATTGWGIGLAVLTCGKAMNLWWTE
jgi:hypothetical protein